MNQKQLKALIAAGVFSASVLAGSTFADDATTKNKSPKDGKKGKAQKKLKGQACNAKGNGATGDFKSDAAEKAESHSCAGKNSCKGKGGCRSGDNGCAGKNSCKGKGGCSAAMGADIKKSEAPEKVKDKHSCKGQHGCPGHDH